MDSLRGALCSAPLGTKLHAPYAFKQLHYFNLLKGGREEEIESKYEKNSALAASCKPSHVCSEVGFVGHPCLQIRG